MKYSSLIACLLISAQIGAQTTTTPSSGSSAPVVTPDASVIKEGAMNDKLLDNASLSQQYLKQSGYKESTNKFLKGSSPEAQAAAKENLTDQEKQLVENYVDQAAINKIMKEKCVGEMKQACAGQEVDHKIMGMDPGLIKMATTAYATIGALGSDFASVSKGSGEWMNGKTAEAHAKATEEAAKKATGDAQQAANEAKNKAAANAQDKKASDWCKYIPAGTEMIAQFQQSKVIKDIDAATPAGGDTSQKEMLLKAAKSHDSRGKQAQMQAVGWFGGAACYAYQAASGAFAVDTTLVVKLGAAAFLGTFYQMEANANKEYGDKVREIANSFPGKGQCNPITENTCYCEEEEHKNDQRYCMAQIQARQAAAAQFTKVACVDNKIKLDPSCSCDKSNSCFDKVFEPLTSADFSVGFGMTNNPFKPLASLARGRLDNSLLTAGGYAQTSAIAKKMLAELANKVPSGSNPLNATQKEAYDTLLSKGIPANAARIMAMNPPPASAIEAAKGKIASIGVMPALDNDSYSKGRSNVVDFSGGNGLGVSGRKNEKKSGVEDFLGKLNPNQKNANPGKILEFAQKAERQAAQVSKQDRPIFEIISLRYQLSGRRLLQLDQPEPAAPASAGN